MLHSVRRMQSLTLLMKVANMKELQSTLEAHSCWHSSSDRRSKTAPTMFVIGSSEQRSPFWKRSHWAASNPTQQQLNRKTRWLSTNMILAAPEPSLGSWTVESGGWVAIFISKYCLSIVISLSHYLISSQVPQLYCIQLGVQYPKNSKI